MLLSAAATACAYDVHFDYTSFDNPGTPGANPHFGQNQFNVLNYPSLNGNYMMTSTDAHRADMVANGNALAEFYNTLTTTYTNQTTKDGAAGADTINSYTLQHSTNTGARPDWLVLNEISSGLWQDGTSKGDTYRKWLVDCATKLHETYHYNVVAYAPFPNPGLNDATWQALSAESYIGIERYISGAAVMAGGTDYASRLAFCEAAYQSSKASYLARGIPADRLFLGEHFGNTASSVAYGRGGVSADDWDTVLPIRQDAIAAVGFAGFLAYGWGSNPMLISEAEQVQHEYYYRSRLALPGQQPQWLMDDAVSVNTLNLSLSWGEPLDWIGGVPDAPGAVANFYRTNTAARTITLDAPRTVGTLTFNSTNSYTITPGTGGGSIALDNGGATAQVSVAAGAHTITAPVAASDSVNFDIATGGALTLSGTFSNAGPRTFTKSGGGALTFSGAQSHAAGSAFVATGGVTNFNTDGGSGLAVTANATVSFGVAQHLVSLTVGAGSTATLTSAGDGDVLNVGSLSVAGKLDLTHNAMVVRSGAIGAWNGSAYTGVTGSIASGRNGGDWSGSGVVTTVAAPSDYTTLGVATAADALSIAADATDTWRGQSVTGNSVLAMYTYGGDANLDGIINIDDYTQIDSSVSTGGALRGWFNGDFNYDGEVNIDDYTIIDSNMSIQGAPLNGAAVAAAPFAANPVPEPTGAAVLAACAASSLLRRRPRT